MDMDTDFEQDLAKVIDNQRAQTVFNRWKMRTTKDRAESSSSIGSITETAAEVQARLQKVSIILKDGLSKTAFQRRSLKDLPHRFILHCVSD